MKRASAEWRPNSSALCGLLACVVLCGSVGEAKAGGPPSYLLTADAIHVGAVGPSSSLNYVMTSGCVGGTATGPSSSTSFLLHAGCPNTIAVSVCGNTVHEPGEQCDDGNTDDGDCCSSVCAVESDTTECRPVAGECDLADFCDGNQGFCPADTFQPLGTACSPDGNPCSLDICDGASSDCAYLPDQSPGCIPIIAPGDLVPNTTNVRGTSNPDCPGGVISLYDCGPEDPPICYDETDRLLGMTTKNPDGSYSIDVPPLQPGTVIYVTDSCTDPALRGAPAALIVSPAPVLSPVALGVALLLLSAIAGVAHRRRARRVSSAP